MRKTILFTISAKLFKYIKLSNKFFIPSGGLYPAYASYKAVRSKNVREYVKWMMYWIVLATFSAIEQMADLCLTWLPFYYEVKILLILWLLSPATKGSSMLYKKFLHPALARREQVEVEIYYIRSISMITETKMFKIKLQTFATTKGSKIVF